MAVNAAKAGQTCGIFSLEMTREQLAMRVLSSEANIDSHRLRLGLYTHNEESRVIDAIGMLSDLPVFIDDTPYQGMVEMRGKARRLALEKRTGPAGRRLPAAGAGQAALGTIQPGAGDHRDIP